MIDGVKDQQLMSIGEFARRARLSVKALRLYSANGLLSPVAVDPATGYRRYGVEQVTTARLIGLLRGAGVGLVDIAAVLAEGEAATARVDALWHAAETEHAARRLLVRHIRSVLRHEESTMFEVHTRHVPAQRVLSIQRRLRVDRLDAFATEARAAFAGHLAGTAVAGAPFTLIYHGVVDERSDGPVEAVIGCPDGVGPTDMIGVRTEPAHDEAYTTITKAQWAFPAILAVYDAVACAPEAIERPGQLACREVYLAVPDDLGDDDSVCDVVVPLGDAQPSSHP